MFLMKLNIGKWKFTCNLASNGYYYASICNGTDAAGLITNSVVQKCIRTAPPSMNQYAYSYCLTGNLTSNVGSDGVVYNCSAFTPPSTNQYVKSLCRNATSSSVGTNFVLSNCLRPSIAAGQYTATICSPGNATTLGTDTTIASCAVDANVPDKSFITSFCDAGSPNIVGGRNGMNLQFSACTSPSNNEYVTKPCFKGNGTLGLAGTNTKISNCTSPPLNSYVTSKCVSGNYNTNGTNTLFTSCSFPSSKQYVNETCNSGDYHNLGSNTKLDNCSFSDNDVYKREKKYFTKICKSGSPTEKGQNSMVADCTHPSKDNSDKCSSIEVGEYVSSSCKGGEWNVSTGTNTVIKSCSEVNLAMTTLRKCLSGSYDAPGLDIKQTGLVCKDFQSRDDNREISMCVCASGYYSGSSSSSSSCVSCPLGRSTDVSSGVSTSALNCSVNTPYNMTTIMPGYYKVLNEDYQLVAALPCPPGACNSNTSGSTTVCSSGYQGFQCSTCTRDYYNAQPIKEVPSCNKCPPNEVAASATVFSGMGLMILGQLLFIAFLVYMKIKKGEKSLQLSNESNKKVKVKQLTSVLQRLTISHLQILAIIGQFDFKWPVYVKTMFQVSSTASTLNVMDNWNLLGVFKCKMYNSSLPAAVNELLLGVYEFSVVLVLSLVFWSIYGRFWRKGENFISRLQDNGKRSPATAATYLSILQSMAVTVITIIYMKYSNINKAAFQLFTCVTIDPFLGQNIYTPSSNKTTAILGKAVSLEVPSVIQSRLQGSLDIICYSPEHYTLLLSYALPIFLLFIIGMPLFAFVYIFSKRRQSENALNLELSFGFLYEGYRDKFWFWEWIVLARKVGLSAISVLLSTTDTYIQGLAALFVVTIAFALQAIYRPYETSGGGSSEEKENGEERRDDLNSLETRGLLVSLMTIYLGMWTFASKSAVNEGTEWTVTISVFVLNITWMLFILFKFYQGSKEKVLSSFKRMWECGCCVKKRDGVKSVEGIVKGMVTKEKEFIGASQNKNGDLSIEMNIMVNPLHSPCEKQKIDDNKIIHSTKWSFRKY